MRHFLSFLVSFFYVLNVVAAPAWFPEGIQTKGSSTIGEKSTANSSAVLDVRSTTKGMLPPRMTTAQRTAIASPATGLLVYDTDTLTVWQYNGTGWVEVGSGGAGGAQYNVIKNYDFEATTYSDGWTASAGVLAAATGTNILFGDQSATWDASATSQTLSYTSQAIGQGYKNNNCEGAIFVQTPSGTASHTLQVYDGTNVLASVSITSYTTPKEFSTGAFPCPSSGNWQLRIVSNADEPLIAVDNAYLGLARNVGTVAQAFYKGSINMSGCTDWTRSNGTFGGFTATSGCTYSVTGDVLAPSTFIPGFRLQNVAPGRYLIIARGYFGKTVSTTNADVSFRFSDGTNTFAERIAVGAASASGQALGVGELTGSIGYTTAQGTLTFQIQGQVSNTGSSTAAVISDDAGAHATGEITGLQFEVFYFPTQSQQVVQPNQQRAPKVTHYLSGSGTHTWSNGVTHATIEIIGGGGGGGGAGTSSTAGGAGGQSSFDGVNAPGGAGGPAGLASSGGNPGAATVVPCTTNETFMCRGGAPGTAGTVTDSVASNQHAPGGSGGNSRYGGAGGGQYETSGTAAQANTGSGGGGGAGDAATFRAGAGGSAGADITWHRVAPSGTASYSVGAAGAAGTGTRNGGAGGSGYIKVTEYFGYTTAILANSVTTKRQSGDRILSGTFNCDASSTVTRTNEPDTTSIGNIASGACAVAYAPFSAAPDACTPVIQTCAASSGTGCFARASTAATASGVSVQCYSDTGTLCTSHDFYMICTGPR